MADVEYFFKNNTILKENCYSSLLSKRKLIFGFLRNNSSLNIKHKINCASQSPIFTFNPKLDSEKKIKSFMLFTKWVDVL